VRVSWDASLGATSYKIYRALSAAGTKSLQGSTSGIAYNDTTATPGVTYYYWVVAYRGTSFSGYSISNTGWRKLIAPASLLASDGTYTDKVLLSWSASSAATSYNVYRATSPTGTKSLRGSPVGTTFNDTNAIPGASYTYWVMACNGTSCSDYSAYDTGWRKLSPPTNLQASDGTYTDKVLLTWTASSGASSYRVYRATSPTGTKTLLGTPTGTTFNDLTAIPGITNTYTYWVMAFRGTSYSSYSTSNTGWRKP
jgi:fibronectin type 3 domain-containing protein